VDLPNFSTPATTCDDAGVPASKPTAGLDHTFPLTEYIPLGCLLGPNTFRTERSQWEEVSQTGIVSEVLALRNLEPLLAKLLEAQWIRMLVGSPLGFLVLRVYVLPDDIGNSTIDRGSKSLRLALTTLVEALDVSKRTWSGRPKAPRKFDLWATGVNHSLFWLFNTLPSPSPSPEKISDRYSRLPAEELLEQDPYIPGLTAKLFRYQTRSVAAMIERESAPQQKLDPRFERRSTPEGISYFYNPRDMIFRRKPVYYECSRGGILAETMGVGSVLSSIINFGSRTNCL
jgi:hypothetical protein